MIKFQNSLVKCGNTGPVVNRRAFDQDNGDFQRSCGGKLAISCWSTAVFGDDQIDFVVAQKRQFARFVKRASGENITDMGQGERWLDRVNAANDIMMLRGLQNRAKFLTAKRHKNALGCFSGLGNGLFNSGDLLPLIPLNRKPWCPAQSEKLKVGLADCGDSICGYVHRKRVGGINQNGNVLRDQIACEPFCTTKAASAHRHGLSCRVFGATGQRQGDVEVGARRQSFSQQAGFISAAKNEKSGAHV